LGTLDDHGGDGEASAGVKSLNSLTLNDPYIGRTAPLTSRRCILYICVTNICTELLNMLHTLRFFLFKMPFIS